MGLLATVLAGQPLSAQSVEDSSNGQQASQVAEAESETKLAEKKPPVALTYGSKGLELRSADGNYRAWFGLRAQLRSTFPFEDDPRTLTDLDGDDEVSLSVNRARFKWGGHAYRPWLDYYLEYDLVDSQLLDLRFTVEKWKALQIRVGQWKAEYNRERRDSSGEQQFAERSIATRPFTLDRQNGLMISGRLWEGRAIDSHYWLGWFNGSGLGNYDSEGEPLYVARWQWNFTRRELEFSQGDLERRPEPHGSLAVAAARNRSRFTRFSSDGGGELEGFPSDAPERYDVDQLLFEAAFQQRGFSFQAEAHWKEIEDRRGEIGENGRSTYEGGYAQAGYFFHELWESFPTPLEFALRVARVDATEAPVRTAQGEVTLATNWFFNGHRNKLTVDVSRLNLEAPDGDDTGVRFRLQWDVSF